MTCFFAASGASYMLHVLRHALLQVLVLGREKEGIPPEIISMLDATVEIPQLGVIRSLNVHVSGAIAMYEFTKQQLGAR
jgi:tRNA G18 (ribose-2'-O)-methylase SpoU